MLHISKTKAMIMLVIFFVSIFLVFYGRTKIGYFGLFLQILGIIGLLSELYLYNKQYR